METFEGHEDQIVDLIGEKAKDCGVKRLVPESTEEQQQEVQEIIDSLPPRS